MKAKPRVSRLTSLLLAVMMVVSLFAVMPSTAFAEDEPPVLLDLFADHSGVRYDHIVGDTLDLSELKVIAHYSDASSREV
ncbi:MAG: hypothetical protein FWE76_07015, partial [Symbiobacteriaceae bacterium]|nr:hypothetical protein [Symbiobacteriaceae bacterium]